MFVNPVMGPSVTLEKTGRLTAQYLGSMFGCRLTAKKRYFTQDVQADIAGSHLGRDSLPRVHAWARSKTRERYPSGGRTVGRHFSHSFRPV